MKRVFIAINLPEEIKKNLEKVEQDISAMFPEENRGVLKWVKKDNLHLTLIFVGYVQDEEIARICQDVEQTLQGLKPFSLGFKRVCYGPPKKLPPRLIWIELQESKELRQIVERLGQVEFGQFSAHITLARIRTWQWKQIEPEERPDIARELDLSFEVKSVEVMESTLKRSGPEYTILQSFQI